MAFTSGKFCGHSVYQFVSTILRIPGPIFGQPACFEPLFTYQLFEHLCEGLSCCSGRLHIYHLSNIDHLEATGNSTGDTLGQFSETVYTSATLQKGNTNPRVLVKRKTIFNAGP